MPTPGYKLHCIMDDWLPVIIRPVYLVERNAHELGRHLDAQRSKMIYNPVNDGWSIRGFVRDQYIYSNVDTPPDSGSTVTPGLLTVTGGQLTAADKYVEYPATGGGLISLLADIATLAIGNYGLKKRVASSDSSYISTLAADQTSFPSPTAYNQGNQMERAVITNSNWNWRRLWAVYFINEGRKGITGFPRRVLFTGPAWGDAKRKGDGNYAVTVNDEGHVYVEANLKTDGDYSWQLIHEQRVPVTKLTELMLKGCILPTLSGGFMIWISVSDVSDPDHVDNPHGLLTNLLESAAGFAALNTPGKIITIPIPQSGTATNVTTGADSATQTVTSTTGMTPGDMVRFDLAQADRTISSVTDATHVVLTSSVTTTTGEAVTLNTNPQPLRVEVASKERMRLHVYGEFFPDSGYIEDIVDLVHPRSGSDGSDPETLILRVYNDIPTGTSITPTITDYATGDTITTGSVTSGVGYTDIPFTPLHSTTTTYKYRLTANASSDHFSAPTIFKAGIFADAVTDAPDVDTFELDSGFLGRTARNFSMHDGGSDPLGGAAEYEFTDLDGSGTAIRARGEVATHFHIAGLFQTAYNSTSTSSQNAHIFRGYMVNPFSQRLAQRRNTIKDNAWTTQLYFVSEMHRTQHALSQVYKQWVEPNGKAWKVTDRIAYLLNWVYASDHIDIVDKGATISVAKDATQTFPFEDIGELVKADAANYYSAYVTWDLGEDKVRMIEPTADDAVALTQFLSITPQDADFYTYEDGHVAPIVSMRFRPVYSYEQPRYNCVEVLGGLNSTAAATVTQGSLLSGAAAPVTQNQNTRLVQKLYRLDAFNFLGLDPTDPKYPRPLQPGGDTGSRDYKPFFFPLVYPDLTLSTPDLVNWVTLRLFIGNCFGRDVLSFEAPFVPVWDPARHATQIRPRPLRMFDLVEVEDPQTGDFDSWMVRRVTIPKTRFTTNMWAHYEVVKVAWPVGTDGKVWRGAIEGARGMTATSRRNAKAGMGVGKDTPTVGTVNLKALQDLSRLGGMVHTTLPALQILDTGSSDYGKIDHTQIPSGWA